jgi:Holliday junction resolvase-like predicted endonuclease
MFERYNIDEITIEELTSITKQLKRRQAPGPDEIPTELIKEMNEENLNRILELLNTWWREENIEEADLRARVVLIFKKGDSNIFENYRPISLLNTLYKIFAAILQRRISKTLDRHLQKTQYLVVESARTKFYGQDIEDNARLALRKCGRQIMDAVW